MHQKNKKQGIRPWQKEYIILKNQALGRFENNSGYNYRGSAGSKSYSMSF
jgi:hypothetical protein